MNKKYEIPWWGKWLDANCLERAEMIEKLTFAKNMIELSKAKNFPMKYKLHSINTMLLAFFEDLEDALYTKLK